MGQFLKIPCLFGKQFLKKHSCSKKKVQKCVLKTNFARLIRQVIERNGLSRLDAISAFENCRILPLNRSKITITKTALSLTCTNTPLLKYMNTSSTPHRPFVHNVSYLNNDFSKPPNQLESIMKQFESASSEISHNLKNSISQLFREKI